MKGFLLAVVFLLPAGGVSADETHTVFYARPSWRQYMQTHVYGRADRRCSRLAILCSRKGESGLFSVGVPRRPKPGDGLQIRFGAGAEGMLGPNPSQEDAPITDAINKAAPVVNTGLFLAALILFLL